MEVDQRQAQEALQDVEAIAQSVRDKLAYAPTGPILTLWGIIWIICFAISQFDPSFAQYGWLIGDSVGFAGSFVIGRLGRQARSIRSASSKRIGRRMFWSWLLLFIYGDLWLAILWPWRQEQLNTFIITLVMFAYVIMGIWLQMRFVLFLGLAVTILTCAGYVYFSIYPGYLNLWLGLTGGSALLGSGVYLMMRWK